MSFSSMRVGRTSCFRRESETIPTPVRWDLVYGYEAYEDTQSTEPTPGPLLPPVVLRGRPPSFPPPLDAATVSAIEATIAEAATLQTNGSLPQ